MRAPLVVALAIGAVPLFAWLSHMGDLTVGARMRLRVERTAQDAAALLDAGAPLDELARRRGLWIRVVDAAGVTTVDLDHDPPVGLARWSTDLFFGPQGAPSLAAWDAGLPPVQARPLVEQARVEGVASACEQTNDGGLLICSAAAELDDGRLVYVRESSRRAIRALYDVRYQLVKLSLQVLCVGLLLGLWLGWRMVRPVELLRRQVLARTAAGSTRPVELDRDDELGDLAQAFNQLLAALEARRRENEAFAADLVHELKNPVAAVRAAAEQLQRGELPPDRARRLARVLDDAGGRLDALVSQFLELARAEAGLRDQVREVVDLAALARALVEAARARHEDVSFALEGGGPLPVRVVAGRLEAAVRNLVDNAVVFAREGEGRAEVRLRLRAAGEQAVLEVEDSGPGIATEDRDRVFDRYFTRRHGGTGLGLPLARAVARAHQGELELAPSARGACFRLRLPAA